MFPNECYLCLLKQSQKLHYRASKLRKFTQASSIKVCCRCKTVEALYGLKQLINSGKMANHFSRIIFLLLLICMSAENVLEESDV